MKKAIGLALSFAAITSVAEVPSLLNYQGRLVNGTNLVNGAVSLQLRLFNVPVGGSSIYEDSNNVTVADGLYSTFIGDHPTNSAFLEALTNAAVYVETAVNGVTLAPRERLASVGYALATRGLLATTNGSIVLNPAENEVNSFSPGASVGGGYGNVANADYAAVGGGYTNQVGYSSYYSTIGGGIGNRISGSTESTVLGGQGNVIQNTAHKSTIGGGYFNVIESLAFFSTVAGGNQNAIRFGAEGSAIPGGYANEVGAGATYSMAAGKGALVSHSGSFVWNDNGPFLHDFTTTDTNQFLVRASGGVGINTNRPGAALHVRGEAIVGPDDTAARFAMKRVGMTASGTVFTHPSNADMVLAWDSTNRVLTASYTAATNYCDVQMMLVRENADTPLSAAADINAVTAPVTVSLTNSPGENAGWSVTAILETSPGGPGYQFTGTGWGGILNGLVTYWY